MPNRIELSEPTCDVGRPILARKMAPFRSRRAEKIRRNRAKIPFGEIIEMERKIARSQRTGEACAVSCERQKSKGTELTHVLKSGSLSLWLGAGQWSSERLLFAVPDFESPVCAGKIRTRLGLALLATVAYCDSFFFRGPLARDARCEVPTRFGRVEDLLHDFAPCERTWMIRLMRPIDLSATEALYPQMRG